MHLDFRVIVDNPTQDALAGVFGTYWPAYQRWMRHAGRSTAEFCRQQLTDHMPELVDAHAELVSRFGGGDEVARFLTMYDPPRVVRGCTQLVLDAESGPSLLRTYDHHPRLFDGIVLHSRWCGTDTLVVTDCCWGALDGVNGHGLAIALAFGGRNVRGPGFAAPLICRYILETCADVTEARDALERLPVYMPYTFVVVDRTGDFVTAFLGPDRPAKLVKRRASANHQGAVEWPPYATSSGTLERLACAEHQLQEGRDSQSARQAFLTAPVWRTDYTRASGTLYCAEYSTSERAVCLRWPGRSERVEIAGVRERRFLVELSDRAVAS